MKFASLDLYQKLFGVSIFCTMMLTQIKELEPSAQIWIFDLDTHPVGHLAEGTMVFMLS